MKQSGSVSYHDDIVPLLVPIDSVHPHEGNYNNGDVEEVMNSIVVNGMYRPVYVQDSTDRIIAGNTTWLACKTLDATEIPVVRLHVEDVTTARIMVGDNEIARRAKPDTGQLVDLLDMLQREDGTLMGTGVTADELENLRLLNDIPLDTGEHGSWPSLCFQVHPQTKAAFMAMTDSAGGDRERFELLMRLAGWRS